VVDYVAGEGREKRLADIAKCEEEGQHLLQQATAVPLTLVLLHPTLQGSGIVQPSHAG